MIIRLDECDIEDAIKLYIKQEFGKTPTDVILIDATDGCMISNVEASCCFGGGE